MNQNLALGPCSLGSVGLAAGTTTTYTRATAIVFMIENLLYALGAASNQTTPTTDINTGAAFVGLTANQASMFVLGVNAAGTIVAAQGPVVSNIEVTGGSRAIEYPQLPAGYAPFGAVRAQAASNLSGTWTFGSSNLSSVTGMTWAFQNLMQVPTRPAV